MKIRTGFVSNSSSTSYVILIPEGFDVDDHVYSNLEVLRDKYRQDNWREYPRVKKGEPKPKVILPYDYIEDFIKRFKKYLKSGSLYSDDDRFTNGDLYTISDMMKTLIIASVEGAPDQGTLTFVKQDKVNKMINDYEAADMGETKRAELRSKIKKDRENYEKIKKDKEEKMKGIDPYGEENWWER